VQHVPGLEADIPEEWLKMLMKKHLTPEEKAKLEKLGWDKLMEEFKKRLAEQKERHSGGSKWIGTGGSSPFGHGGYHPEGIRIGGESAGNRTAIKVWENREYRNLDDTVELGTRNIKIALRRLRRFAREGAEEELDLDAASEFLILMSALLEIKSAQLLPRPGEFDLEELSPEEAREELVIRLITYKKFKDAAAWLRERFDQTRNWRFRAAPLPRLVQRSEEEQVPHKYDPVKMTAALNSIERHGIFSTKFFKFQNDEKGFISKPFNYSQPLLNINPAGVCHGSFHGE